LKTILFINPPGPRYLYRGTVCTYLSKARYVWKPKDFILLSSQLPKDWVADFVDASINGLGYHDTIEKIRSINPDVAIIALSSIIWEGDLDFLKHVRQLLLGRRLFIFGDALLEEEFLDQARPFCDQAIFDPLRFNLERACLGDIVDSTKGTAGRSKDTRAIETHIPRHELFDSLKYRWPFVKNRRYAAVYTQFGCPYTCSYCTESTTNVSYRTSDQVLEELRYLKAQGYRELHMGDASFGFPRGNTIALLKGMIEQRFDFGWSCYIHPAQGDEEVLDLMAKAGCHTVVTGIDSKNFEMLKTYGRVVTDRRIRDFVSGCHRRRIDVCGDIMLGFKGDTYESCLETCRYAIDLDLDYVSINIVTPLMGSSIREEYKKEAFFRESRTGFDTAGIKGVIGTANLTREDLIRLRSQAVQGFYLRPKYLLRRLLRIRSWENLIIQLNEGLGVFLNLLRQKALTRAQ
jgi:anaerobic magnesium-protoporphyrin IX monomethyl ester cyclase